MTTTETETPSLNVDVWLDFASLPSYLALRAFRSALAKADIRERAVVFPRAFFSSTQAANHLVQEALSQGIVVAKELPKLDTRKAQQLVAGLESAERGADTTVLRLAEALMRSYFELGLNIESDETLIAVAQDCGVNGDDARDALASPAAAAQVEDGYTLALHLGVAAAPVFIFGETFVVDEPTESAFEAAFNALKGEPLE